MKELYTIDGKVMARETKTTISVEAETPQEAIDKIKQGKYTEQIVYTSIPEEKE